MNRKFLVLWFVVLLSPLPGLAGTLAGRVFLDANGNGRFDAGEKGVAGCVVSDERALTRSEADGRYRLELPAGPATFFVVNASGTWPSGKWWGHLADGAKGGAFDFPLREANQAGVFYFVHGTDMHIKPEAMPLYRRYISHVNALPVPLAFVVHTGDLIIDALKETPERALKLFNLYDEANQAFKPPLRSVKGNHDVVGITDPQVRETQPGYGKALYRERIGPVHYAFRHGPYHFIALDGTTIKGRNISAGLTKESADWAISYLAGVATTNEPVVLLIHEPLYPESGGYRLEDDPVARPHEGRLLEALKGKKLLLTLAGHVHQRSEARWGGAPHILGGAVSYAWHGFQPSSPSPRGYVLYRIEGNQIERVYLDWAEERSIDILSPPFTEVMIGRQLVNGVVEDLTGDITAVDCALADRSASAKLAPFGHLSKAFAMSLDFTDLADGVYPLVVTARAGGRKWEERQPTVVYSGRHTNFAAAGPAKLTFHLEGELLDGTRIFFNGKQLTTLPAGVHDGKELSFDVPSERLRRMNEVRFELSPNLGAQTQLVFKGAVVDYQGKRFRDVRYPLLAPRLLFIDRSGKTAHVSSYIDLVYDEHLAVKR